MDTTKNPNEGASVVRADGIVLNGNGRVGGMKECYRLERVDNRTAADEYRQELIDRAEDFGIDSDEVEQMKNPLLVREVTGELDSESLTALTRNTEGGAKSDPEEQARMDADNIKSNFFREYVPNLKDDLKAKENREFVQDILLGISTPEEYPQYFGSLGLTDAGEARVRQALLYYAFQSDQLVSNTSTVDTEGKNLQRALEKSAATFAKIKSYTKDERVFKYDLTPIKNAAEIYLQLRKSGKKVPDYLNEIKIDGEEDSAETRELLRIFDKYTRSGKKLTDFVQGIADGIINQGNPNQGSMWGEPEPAPFSDIINQSDRNVEDTGEKTIEQAAEDPTLAGGIEQLGGKIVDGKVQADAKTEKAILNHLENINGGDVKLSVAWHGSPHKFENFSLKAIGTGEGAQAHGWGLYFADSKEVSEGYKQRLSRDAEGNVYKVDIPDVDVLLDEQKHWRNQSKIVKNAIQNLVKEMSSEQKKQVLSYPFRYVRVHGILVKDARYEKFTDTASNEELTERVLDRFKGMRGGDIYDDIGTIAHSDKAASELLNKYGIKGITYDGGRDGRCYVVFDDKAIEILEKYSKDAGKTKIESFVNPKELNAQQKAISDFGQRMGTPIVYFKGSKNLNGIHGNGITYINVDSKVSPEWIFGHETYHWLAENNPTLHNELLDEVKITDKQIEDWKDQTNLYDLTDNEVREEILADTFHDTLKRAGLLKQIGKQNKSLVQKLVGWLKSMLDKFASHFHNPKGGLTTKQRKAMYTEFAKDVSLIVDGDGNKIFRVNNRTHEIQLADGKNLVDNATQKADNIGKNLTDNQKQTLFNTIKNHIENYIDEQTKSGISEEKLAKELTSENSRHRSRTLGALQASLRDFENRANDKEHRRLTAERILGDKNLTDAKVDEVYNKWIDELREAVDYGGILYQEIALNRAGTQKNSGSGIQLRSWVDAERQRAEREGTRFTGDRINEKHSEGQGAFSTYKYSISSDDNSSEGLRHKIGNVLSRIWSGEEISENERINRELTKRLKEVSGYKILYRQFSGEDSVTMDTAHKVIRSKKAYDWENLLPKVGRGIAEDLKLTPSKKMDNYIASWLLTGEPNNNSTQAKDFAKAMRENPAQAEILVKLQSKFRELVEMSPSEKYASRIVTREPKSTPTL